MKEFKVGTKLIACEDLFVDDNLCLAKGNVYTIETVDKGLYRFHIIDEEGDAHCFDFSDVPNVWFNFYKAKEDPIVKQVVDSFQERSKVGIEKYGTTLAENNTDDFLEHLQQELMDATLYIQKLKSIKPSLDDFSENEIVEYLRNNGYKVKYKL